MIYRSCCKINIGLNIRAKRPDGYHEIESLFYPVQSLSDLVEVQTRPEGTVEFTASGIAVDCPAEENLCLKAYRLMKERFAIGGIAVHLHKRVPFGAGLGGGSANASTVINAVNDLYGLGCEVEERQRLAAEIGSDTAFFIDPQPMIATSRGEVLTPFAFSLKGCYLTLIKPPVSVSTREAYSRVIPDNAKEALALLLGCERNEWSACIGNDFEPSVFALLPELKGIKERLYREGAFYAAMSGSGSTLFALSGEAIPLTGWGDNVFVHSSRIEQ